VPDEAGAENETVMLPSPAVASPRVGAPGAAGGGLPPPPLQATSKTSESRTGRRSVQRSDDGIMGRILLSGFVGRSGAAGF
jgi:hypothetical protein